MAIQPGGVPLGQVISASTTSPAYHVGGGASGGGSGFYFGTTTVFSPDTITLNGMITNNVPPSRLCQDEIDLLMRSHVYIPKAGSEYCLFCFALDRFRTAGDHLFVICEE